MSHLIYTLYRARLILQALRLIIIDGIPPLRNPEKWSNHFKDYIDRCLQISSLKRATSAELMKVFVLSCDGLCLPCSIHSMLRPAISQSFEESF
jgi:serine/threonine protein kinase